VASEQPPPTGPPPGATGVDPKEGFGCFVLILVFLICSAAAAIFRSASAGGEMWAGLAVCALAAMGYGIVYLGVKYHS
jgi:hypothetical protein